MVASKEELAGIAELISKQLIDITNPVCLHCVTIGISMYGILTTWAAIKGDDQVVDRLALIFSRLNFLILQNNKADVSNLLLSIVSELSQEDMDHYIYDQMKKEDLEKLNNITFSTDQKEII
jgi:hypothetical protein